jgi:GNAT superfamily N-acetyltransferase
MIDVVPMEKTDESFEFALSVKRDALGPHIVERWGWDDKLQRKQHSEGWAALRFFRIVRDGDSIGIVSLDEARDHVTLVGFYILPSFHRKGIGTEVLVKILSEAGAKRLPVRLRCLKWNPALSLYKRHGFVVTGETDTHFQMEREARGSYAVAAPID